MMILQEHFAPSFPCCFPASATLADVSEAEGWLGAHQNLVAIGIGGQSPVLPSHTTVHAGPHTAVRRIELSVNSQAFCIVPRQETIRSLPGRLLGLHPYLPPEGQTILAFCRVSSLRSHCLIAHPFIPLAGYRSGLRSSFPAWPICCSAFRPLECLNILADCMTCLAL